MKQLKDKEYEEFQQYLYNRRMGTFGRQILWN